MGCLVNTSQMRRSGALITEQLVGYVYLMAVDVMVVVIRDLINSAFNNDPIQARSDEPPQLDYCQAAQVCLC